MIYKNKVPSVRTLMTVFLSSSVACCAELHVMCFHLIVSPEVFLYQCHHRHVKDVLLCDNYHSTMSLGTRNFSAAL